MRIYFNVNASGDVIMSDVKPPEGVAAVLDRMRQVLQQGPNPAVVMAAGYILEGYQKRVWCCFRNQHVVETCQAIISSSAGVPSAEEKQNFDSRVAQRVQQLTGERENLRRAIYGADWASPYPFAPYGMLPM